MNKSYEIIGDEIFVETDRETKTLTNTSNSEKILKVENNIEILDEKLREISLQYGSKDIVINVEKNNKMSQLYIINIICTILLIFSSGITNVVALSILGLVTNTIYTSICLIKINKKHQKEKKIIY